MKPVEHVERFGTLAGELKVGGMPLSRLAARVGSTPFFAYDRTLLDDRIDGLRAALPDRIRLSYAMKANPMPAVVQHLAGRVDRIDVASALELRVALDTGLPPDRVSFAGPGKAPAEIRQAVVAGIRDFGAGVLPAGDRYVSVPQNGHRTSPLPASSTFPPQLGQVSSLICAASAETNSPRSQLT